MERFIQDNRVMFESYKGKKVLVTGHTGFKGSWLCAWLLSVGAEVIGYSDKIFSGDNLYEANNTGNHIKSIIGDIVDRDLLTYTIKTEKPDFIFHLAAQPIVSESISEPMKTFQVNAIGTANLMSIVIELENPVICVLITSDKVYENKEWYWGYREHDKLGGKDPYSASKAMAELACKSLFDIIYQRNLPIKCGIARAGNVIGGGDWATSRIVPDMIKAWSTKTAVELRNPKSTRPWQHVLEPLSGYLKLGNELYNNRCQFEAFNFGPSSTNNYSVGDVVDKAKEFLNLQVKYTTMQNKFNESGLLKLNCDKASAILNWKSKWNFQETIEKTLIWYIRYYESSKNNMMDFTINQIQEYTTKK